MTLDMPELDILEKIVSKNKTDKPYSLVVHNDDVNSFEYVIMCFINFLKHEPTQAEQCTMIVHNNGKCEVKRGSRDDIKTYHGLLQQAGLSVTMEKRD